nr:hypothetical protein [Tanacetum cinerariifolium]
MSLLSLKDAEAVEAISLRDQLSVMEAGDAAKGNELRDLKERNFVLEGEKDALSEKVKILESVAALKETELASLTAQRSSLESAFELFKGRMEAMQDEQAMVLGNKSSEYLQALRQAIGCAVNKGIQDGLKAGVDHRKAGRDLSKKDASMVDLMDSLHLEGPLAEIHGVKDLQPSPEQLMFPIHRPEENVVLGETSLSFSLQIVHSQVQMVRGEIKEKRLSLTDIMVPLAEPLSSKTSTSATPATTERITTLSMTFTSSDVVHHLSFSNDQALDTEPHDEDPLAVTFEKEELDTSLE